MHLVTIPHGIVIILTQAPVKLENSGNNDDNAYTSGKWPPHTDDQTTLHTTKKTHCEPEQPAINNHSVGDWDIQLMGAITKAKETMQTTMVCNI